MKKKLILVRHAKAEDFQSAPRDVDRDLTARGYSDAIKMGKLFEEKGLIPDVMVASEAQRAKATCVLMAEQLKYNLTDIVYNINIYNATVRILLSVINDLDDSHEVAYILGHNPAIAYLGEYLTGAVIPMVRTCGVIHITYEGSWAELSEGIGEFVGYDEPEK